MTDQPQKYPVTIKSPEDIKRDDELSRAYQRGFEDGKRSRPAKQPAPDVLDDPVVISDIERIITACGYCEDYEVKEAVRDIIVAIRQQQQEQHP